MRFFYLALISLSLSGCQISSNEIDPYEQYNREVFAFNEQADEHIIAPIVSLYQTIVPLPFRVGISNFYANVAEVAYGLNFFLQKDYEHAYHSSIRFIVNSTFGVGGLFDMAHDLGLPKKKNDFGKTLYIWGVKESPYMISPFWGPTTTRDMIGMSVDRVLLNPLNYYGTGDLRVELLLLNGIETRASLSEYLNHMNQTTFVQDRYLFVRDSYLQYRKNFLNDGQHNWDDFYDLDWSQEKESSVSK